MTDNEKKFPFNNEPPYPLWWSGQLHHGYLPWYNDRADFNTNAPSYYDYLARFNGEFISSFIDSINDLLARNILTENTQSITIKKIGDWQKTPKGDSVITISGDVNISDDSISKTFNDIGTVSIPNGLVIRENGLYSPDYYKQINDLYLKLKALREQFSMTKQPTKKWAKFKRSQYLQDGDKTIYNKFEVGLEYYQYAIEFEEGKYQIVEGVSPSLTGCKIVEAPNLAVLGTLSNDELKTNYGFTNRMFETIGNNTAGFSTGYWTSEGIMLMIGLRQRNGIFEITLERTSYPSTYPVNLEMQQIELQFREFIHEDTKNPFK